MIHHLRLIGLFARVSIQNDAAYRIDFLVQFLVTLLHFGAELVGLWTIFSNTNSIGGWDVYEVLALLGVFRTMSGIIALLIAPNMRIIMEEIRDGKLDYLVIKPINAQFYASFRRLVIWRLTEIMLGLLLVVIACVKLSAQITPLSLLLFVVLLSAGVVIIYSFWLVLATCAFWFTRISNIEMVFWNVFEAGRYPVDIYRPSIRYGLTYLIPLAFITTIPAGSLVGKTELSGVIGALVMAAISFTLASAFWRFGLRHYSGASA